jgi:hypothetical protein
MVWKRQNLRDFRVFLCVGNWDLGNLTFPTEDEKNSQHPEDGYGKGLDEDQGTLVSQLLGEFKHDCSHILLLSVFCDHIF